MSDDTHMTVILLTSKHDPTDVELEATLRGVIEVGGRQGYEPLHLTAVRPHNGSTVKAEDRERIEKWKVGGHGRS